MCFIKFFFDDPIKRTSLLQIKRLTKGQKKAHVKLGKINSLPNKSRDISLFQSKVGNFNGHYWFLQVNLALPINKVEAK